MANFKEQMEATTTLRRNIIKAMNKPRTARQISELIGISCYNSQYHISCLIKEGYAKHVGMTKPKFAPANLYKKLLYMGEYVMKARALPMSLEEKLIKHKPIKSAHSTIYNHFNDSTHFAKMNQSKTQAKTNYYVNGSTLSHAF